MDNTDTQNGLKNTSPTKDTLKSLKGLDDIPVFDNSDPNANIIEWMKQHQSSIDALMLKHGGLLLRNFQLRDKTHFQEVSQQFVPELADYVEGGTPRTNLGNSVYTSTEYPEKLTIFPHNELSYVTRVPEKIVFSCLQAPIIQGATPLTDCRKVLAHLAPDVRQEFEQRKWKLVRNFGTGLGPDLMRAFGTEDLVEIEKYCGVMQMQYEKISEHQVRTTQIRPAIHTHPITQEQVWMNHIAFWHPSSLEPQVREEMLAAFGQEGMPFNVFWGDGEVISDDIANHIREAYQKAKVRFDWKKGDVLLMDNVLVAHGREPFAGPRKILVAMGYR